MKKIVYVLAMVFMAQLGLQAQNKTTIPLDPNVKIGQLENGMTYYVLQNKMPEGRASFYFAQNVGAILEEDSQNGLAHFLEHMAFNGLEHYPGKSMFKYLEGYGIKFGAQINAFTGQDETVYNISGVASDNQNLMDSVLLVLHDWSGGLLLKAEEIEAERGVINEEWRSGNNFQRRIQSQAMAYYMNHSKYAQRDVIGSMDVVNNFEHKELRDYYHKWYRPDLQSVIVVGDIDTDRMVTRIKEIFSTIPMPKNAAERPYYSIEDTDKLDFAVIKDKEAPGVQMEWLCRRNAPKVRDNDWYRQALSEEVFIYLFNNRLRELLQDPQCPAMRMSPYFTDLSRTKSASGISIMPKQGRELESFELMMTEYERVKRYGFTQPEMDRAKVDYEKYYERLLLSKDQRNTEQLARSLYEYHLKALPFADVKSDIDLKMNWLKELTSDDMKNIAEGLIRKQNSVIVLSGTDKPEVVYPTKNELLSIVDKLKTQEIAVYQEEVIDAPLFSEDLKEAKIIDESFNEAIQGKEYKLNNGAKVIVINNDNEESFIRFYAVSQGGLSTVGVKDIPSGGMSARLAMASGVSEFSGMQLQKLLTGKEASINCLISANVESISGKAGMNDLEEMLQLLYLQLEKPRFEENIFKMQKSQMQEQLKQIALDNAQVLRDTVNALKSGYHERNLSFNEDYIANCDFEKAKRIFKERYSNAADFTFIFLGKIDEEKHLPLIVKYVGNISSSDKTETFIDHNIRPVKGHTVKVFEREMATPKTSVKVSMNKTIKYSAETEMYAKVIGGLLNKRYHATIREEEGGTYGVRANGAFGRLPYDHFELNVSFDCNPDKQEHLRKIVFEEIKNIQSAVDEEDLNEIKQAFIEERKTQKQINNIIGRNLAVNLAENKTLLSDEEYNELVNNVNAETVKKVAKKLFKKADIIEVVMNPKK